MLDRCPRYIDLHGRNQRTALNFRKTNASFATTKLGRMEQRNFTSQTFVAWEHKESGWKQIEPMARDLQNEGCGELYRKVVD